MAWNPETSSDTEMSMGDSERLILEFSLQTLKEEEDRNFSTVTDVRANKPGHGEGHQRKFTCFSGLPLELRQMIWEYALPEPRVLLVDCTSNYVMPGNSESKVYRSVKESCPFLGLRGACQESSAVFKKHYQHFPVLAEETTPATYECPDTIEYAEIDIDALRHQFFDFERDTMYFESIRLTKYYPPNEEHGPLLTKEAALAHGLPYDTNPETPDFLTEQSFQDFGVRFESSKFRNLAIRGLTESMMGDMRKACPQIKHFSRAVRDGHRFRVYASVIPASESMSP
ncbi:hypothetical protein ACMFMG_006367 [Clarireedia jacksonii]